MRCPPSRLFAIATVAIAAGCGAGSAPPRAHAAQVTPVTTTSSSDPIVGRLVAHSYGDLWNYAGRDKVIDAIWRDAGGADRLIAIAADEQAPIEARFLAGEVLFEQDLAYVNQVGAEKMASIYAQALAGNLTGYANSWGLLWEHDDEGPVGIRFSMLGDASIAALRPLLDDARETMRYDGSEEATVGNAYHFRVKDFAAYYLSQITLIPIAYHPAAADRDRAIAELAAKLPAE